MDRRVAASREAPWLVVARRRAFECARASRRTTLSETRRRRGADGGRGGAGADSSSRSIVDTSRTRVVCLHGAGKARLGRRGEISSLSSPNEPLRALSIARARASKAGLATTRPRLTPFAAGTLWPWHPHGQDRAGTDLIRESPLVAVCLRCLSSRPLYTILSATVADVADFAAVLFLSSLARLASDQPKNRTRRVERLFPSFPTFGSFLRSLRDDTRRATAAQFGRGLGEQHTCLDRRKSNLAASKAASSLATSYRTLELLQN